MCSDTPVINGDDSAKVECLTAVANCAVGPAGELPKSANDLYKKCGAVAAPYNVIPDKRRI
jgi:hypothetical protein